MTPARLQRPRKTRRSKSSRAGLIFPVARVIRELKTKYFRKMYRCNVGAGIYTAAILEYVVAELTELAGNQALNEKKKRIQPRQVLLAIAGDQELHEMLKDVIIPGGGAVPMIHRALIPKASGAPKRKAGAGKASRPATKRDKPVASTSTVKRRVPATVNRATPAKPAAPPRQASLKRDSVVVLSEKALHLGQKLTVIRCDITKVPADGVVHPTNSALYTGGLIGQALADRGGADYRNELARLKTSGNLADDAVLLSPAFNINARFVLHCNGPAWSAANCVARLGTTVRNILTVADEKDLRSIAIPSIGSGRAGWPKQTAAETILRAIHGYFAGSAASSLRQIYFVLFDQESIDVYTSELEKLVA